METGSTTMAVPWWPSTGTSWQRELSSPWRMWYVWTPEEPGEEPGQGLTGAACRFKDLHVRKQLSQPKTKL